MRSQSAGDPLQDRSLGLKDVGIACTPINDIKNDKNVIRNDDIVIKEL
jgi:hypothetical protein